MIVAVARILREEPQSGQEGVKESEPALALGGLYGLDAVAGRARAQVMAER